MTEDSLQSAFISQGQFKAPDKIEDSFALSAFQGFNSAKHFEGNAQIPKLKNEANNEANNKDEISPLTLSSLPQSGLIGIRKESLDKEFLLRANMIEGGLAPSFHNLKTRIVAFTKKGEYIFMLEANKGHQFYDVLPQTLILAKFSIKEENSDILYFDFNEGMSKLYVMEDWYAQDFSGSNHPPHSQQFQSLHLNSSYCEIPHLNEEEDYLSIRQIAQVNAFGSNIPVEVRYYLEPYRPSSDFIPSLSSSKKSKVGFFEATPVISDETRRARTFASKFNINKPITFAISANTPEKYRTAIKEGVLYWNNALGKDLIKVIIAPEGVTAPHYKYNVIQWINWKDASSAYADAQLDPRTGEVLNAQIYLSSVFAISGRSKARKMLREVLGGETDSILGTGKISTSIKAILDEVSLDNHDPEKIKQTFKDLLAQNRSQPKSKLTLKGFSQEPMCHGNTLRQIASSIVDLTLEEISEEAYSKIALDYLRDVTAHEVGHVLGLRHNFAGNLAANYDMSKRKDHFKEYLASGSTPRDLIVTSSVMDYLPFKESVMSGNQIKELPRVNSYDQLAIDVLYHGKKIEDLEKNTPLFCTDSHTSQYLDCGVWNASSSTIGFAKYETQNNIDSLPYLLAEYFISYAKSVEEGSERLPFDQILTPSLDWAFELLSPRIRALEAIQADSRSLSIDRKFPYITESNIDEIDREYALALHQDLQTYGGGDWTKILDQVPDNIAEMTSIRFSQIISSEAYRKGMGPAGFYEFTAAEIQKMQLAVNIYMKEMEKSLSIIEAIQLYSIGNISNATIDEEGQELDDQFVPYLTKKAVKWIFSSKTDPLNPSQKKKKASKIRFSTIAKIKGASQEDFMKKIFIVKILIEQNGFLKYTYDDNSPRHPYNSQELSEIATMLLNADIEKILNSTDIQSIIQDVDPSLLLSELKSSKENTDPANEEAPADYIVDIPVVLYLPVLLSDFKYDFKMRQMAAKLLSSRKGESLAFASQARTQVRDLFAQYFVSHLRSTFFSDEMLYKQPKALNSWVQENRRILVSLSEE